MTKERVTVPVVIGLNSRPASSWMRLETSLITRTSSRSSPTSMFCCCNQSLVSARETSARGSRPAFDVNSSGSTIASSCFVPAAAPWPMNLMNQ